MEKNKNYLSPTVQNFVELKIKNSRFIGTAGPALNVESAKESIISVSQKFPGASHHCYAFSVGFGSSATQGMSDDGEPSGTAGRPMLAVVNGAGISDVFVVASRYFGGIKLGMGGLVRAYSDTAKSVLGILKTEVKYESSLIRIVLPYRYYEVCKVRLIEMGSVIQNEKYGSTVIFEVNVVSDKIKIIENMIRDITSGLAQFDLVK